jgi:hypothetical protein
VPSLVIFGSRRDPSAGSSHSSSGRAAQTSVSEPRSATLAPNSVVCGAISSVESRPIVTA